jgi:hypothetical protein
MMMKFYIKRDAVSKTIIESTNIPAHLDQMFKVGWQTAGTNFTQVCISWRLKKWYSLDNNRHFVSLMTYFVFASLRK